MFRNILNGRGLLYISGAAAGLAGCDFILRRSRTVVASVDSASEALSSESADEVIEGGMQLKGLIVLFRHGARTPLRNLVGIEPANYDKNFLDGVVPHTEIPLHVQALDGGERPVCHIQERYKQRQFLGGMEAGKLTKLGKEQVYLLGRRLKHKYIDQMKFLPDKFNQEDIYLRSTNIQRCVDSLQALLAGLFGLHNFSDAEPAIVEVALDKQERLFPNTGACDSLRKMSRQVPSEMEEFEDYVAVVKKIQSITGDTSAVGKFDMMQHRDHMVARQAHGLPVPQWMSDMADDIQKSAVRNMLQYVKGPDGDHHLVLMLSCGRILNIMQNNVSAVSRDLPSARKLYLYSCHDTTLVPVLISLGCYDNKWPNYAADICVEVYQDDNKQHWVKVLYEGEEQVLNGCSKSLITLEHFQDIVRPFSLSEDDYAHKCSDLKAAKQYSAFWQAALTTPTEESEESEAPLSI